MSGEFDSRKDPHSTSLPLQFCELLMVVKENPYRKKNGETLAGELNFKSKIFKSK